MKRFLAAVTAIIMVLSLVTVPIAAEGVETSKVVPAPSVKTEPPAEAYLHGFVLGNNDPDDVAFMWAGFSSTAPETLIEETMMNDIPTAGAYAGGKVYGFLNFGNFYAMDAETFEVDYGGIGTDKMVYSMAYDHSAGVMYAIAMDMWNGPAIFTVDLALGSLEYAAPLNVGVDEDDFPIMLYTLAIDGEGNAYGLAPGDDAALYSIDLETGEGELIGNTGLPLAFMQSMTWDHNTDSLFWAQYGGDDNDNNGLYIIDPVTCETTCCGRIGGGAEIVALWIANDEPIAPIVVPDFNITFIDGLTNEEIPGGYDVPAGTVLNEADFPAPPEHTDYNFLGWDYEGEPVYHDTVVTAKYRNIHAIGFYFETDPEPDGWYWEDHDGDGYYWLWTGSEPDGYFNIPEGEGCMVSYSFAPDNYSALTPDNWLISPVVPGGGNVSFMFTAMYPAYAGEIIGVYASTDGGDTWSDELGYFEATGEIQTPVVDLSQYADQNVQLAFRHYNCTDLLCVSLDAVEVIPGEAIAPPTEEPPTETPTEPPAPPTTGFVSLAGIGIAAVLTGAGIVLFRKKRS